jgi:pSer/pThr/pTyr-binding forkhead associated (FHA) protein
VEQIRIRTRDDGGGERVLGHGSHVLPGQRGGVRLCLDRRGAWLQVDPDESGVLVNGRPVRRMAMLRVGDTVWLDGTEHQLLQADDAGLPPAAEEGGATRLVLRGVGGQYHGRCITLDRPRTVGRLAECDIRVDDPAFAERHARLEPRGDAVVLEPLSAEDDSVVNGEHVRNALLRAGDQVVFDAHHRFVLESPGRPKVRRDMPIDLDDAPGTLPDGLSSRPRSGRSALRRLPWLLLAALLLAAALSGLLLSGAP